MLVEAAVPMVVSSKRSGGNSWVGAVDVVVVIGCEWFMLGGGLMEWRGLFRSDMFSGFLSEIEALCPWGFVAALCWCRVVWLLLLVDAPRCCVRIAEGACCQICADVICCSN